MKKCVHTIVVDNWFPEMCSITVELIKRWADKIKADFNLISKTKFPSFPVNYEKMQIWESGKNYEWNVYLDADMIVNPKRMPDFTLQNPRLFYFEAQLSDPKQCYCPHPYFERDDRNFGISDCFIATPSYYHDLWHPSEISFEELKKLCKLDERIVSELFINLNIARFGLKGLGTIGSDQNHFHLQTTDDFNRPFNGGKADMTKEEHVKRMWEIIKKMEITI